LCIRQLKLRRRLFSSHRSTLQAIGEALSERSHRRSLLAWASVLMLMMIFTVAFQDLLAEIGAA
jgi:hypothetical protein